MRVPAILTALLLAGAAPAQDFSALTGHGGPIHGVAVAPDGTALTASFDNSVGYWNGTAPVWLEAHEAAVKAVIFAGRTRAASAGDDFAITVWDLAAAEPLHRLTGHNGQVAALALSPDGTTLASAGWDGRIGLWDMSDGSRKTWLEGHAGAVNDVAWADAGTLYSASADGTIREWDAGAHTQTRTLVRHGFGVTCLLSHPGGDWLVYGAVDGGTRAVDPATGAELADLTLDRRPILAIAARRDHGQIAVGDGEGHIMVVDTADWTIAHDFRAALHGPIWALAYDADGARILAGGIDDTAYWWPIGAKDAALIAGDRDFLRDPASMPNGERQFRRKCAICHSLTRDGGRRAGPTLAGLFGRPAGSVPGYTYSDAVAGADLTWTAETIDRLFDLGPEHYLPGTKMPMQRITDPADRADLIDFLRENTEG